MIKVYVVYGRTPYEGETTYGVYSSEEKAQAKVDELKTSKWHWHEFYEYEEFELDVS